MSIVGVLPELPGSSSASGLGGTSESDSIMQSSESDDEDEDSSPLLLSTISTTYTLKCCVNLLNLIHNCNFPNWQINITSTCHNFQFKQAIFKMNDTKIMYQASVWGNSNSYKSKYSLANFD